jgi:hypothetical protein
MAIPVAATIADAKQKIAIRYRTIVENVTLLFSGRNINDEFILARQRLGTGKIIVYIREMEPIVLQSIGYTSRTGTPKPPTILECVNRLQAETGRDARTCSRCYTFYDYDYDRALAALQESFDDTTL